MKRIIVRIALITLSIITFTSCEKTNTQKSDNISQYLKLASSVSKGLNAIGNNLRTANKTYNSEEAVLNSAKQLFGKNSNEFNAFLSEYKDAQLKSSLLSTSFNNKEVNDELNRIKKALENSESPSNFIEFLKSEFDNVNTNNNLKPENKDFLLKFIVTYQVSVEYLSNNLELVVPPNSITGKKSSLQIENWWSAWGRCAAGILGGAGLGALSGAAAGSAVPALGTTAGAIIGGIAGGLAGAAAAC